MFRSRLLGAVCAGIFALVTPIVHATSVITYDGRYIQTSAYAYGGSASNDGFVGAQQISDGTNAVFNASGSWTSISTCDPAYDTGCVTYGDIAAQANVAATLNSTATPLLFSGSGSANASGSRDSDIAGSGFSAQADSVYSVGFSIDSTYQYTFTGTIDSPVSFNGYPGYAGFSGGPASGSDWVYDFFNTTGSFSTSGVLLPGDYQISVSASSAIDTTYVYRLPGSYEFTLTLTAVPVPPALVLFGSGLLGLIGISGRKAT